jgi:hypothetical protein
MGTVFWDSEGCKLVAFLESEEATNSTRYVQKLNKLRHALREKRPKKKTVILQHDNARPHIARLTSQTNKGNIWELLSRPPYSPNLAPSDYHLFGPLKNHLTGHHYEINEAALEAVRSWLRGAGTDFYHRGIFKSLHRWKKCINRDGDFVAK